LDFSPKSAGRRLVSTGQLQLPSPTNKAVNPIRRSSAGVQSHMNHNDRGALCQNPNTLSIGFFLCTSTIKEGRNTARPAAATKKLTAETQRTPRFLKEGLCVLSASAVSCCLLPRRYAKKAEYTEKIFPKIQETGGSSTKGRVATERISRELRPRGKIRGYNNLRKNAN